MSKKTFRKVVLPAFFAKKKEESTGGMLGLLLFEENSTTSFRRVHGRFESMFHYGIL